MNKSVEQFILLLASTPFNYRQIHEVIQWIDVNGTKTLEEAVHSIRGVAQNTLSKVEKNVPRTKKPVRLTNESLPAEQIDILLRVEAGLSTAEASELLLKEIHEQTGAISLPKLGKNAFKKWISSLSKNVPDSLLLHCAMKIKNERVPSPKQDWPLRSIE